MTIQDLMDKIEAGLNVIDERVQRFVWTPYDSAGEQYILDDTATGHAYLLTIEYYDNQQGD